MLFGAVAFVAASLAGARAQATEYFVAPTGSDTNPGTMASPFATIQKGNNVAVAGDTVWLRAGTYFSTTQIVFSKSGTSDTNRTKFWAYMNEVPILDCSKYVSTNKAVDTPAVLVTGNWMHLRGLEIANVPVGASGDHSISTLRTKNASNNTFELLNIHNGFGPGLFIDTGTGGNLLLNCTHTTTTTRTVARATDRTPTASAFTIRPPVRARSSTVVVPGSTPTMDTI